MARRRPLSFSERIRFFKPGQLCIKDIHIISVSYPAGNPR
jgi:hypothetical protein